MLKMMKRPSFREVGVVGEAMVATIRKRRIILVPIIEEQVLVVFLMAGRAINVVHLII